MDVRSLALPGCYLIKPVLSRDARGSFVKTVHSSTFARHGLRSDFREQYYSLSGLNVVRGMHFQVPPHDHEKLVYCLAGMALDVIVDLRVGSPQFGRTASVVLDAGDPTGVYVARGCAHGFLSMAEESILLYQVTTEYAAESDKGVRWDTIPFDWPVSTPTISSRDQSFPKLSDFASPFVY